MKKPTKFIISILLPYIAATIGSFFTAPRGIDWYSTLQRPGFSPPNWVFAPVWMILFFLMGLALYLVWAKDDKKAKPAYIAYGIQLALNALWSIVFFGLHQPFYAFIEIIFLWTAILTTIVLFYRISKNAAYLLIPYILWVTFAAILNYYIYILNVM